MKKLINLTVYDVKNMICVWNENDPNADYQQGIALEEAMRGFMVPRHYVVGVFDDGSSKAAGIFNLADINQNGEYDDLEQLFLYDEFVYHVDILVAKAFVRFELANNGNKISEKEAKDNVYKRLLTSGVEIGDKARNYLTS
ncbi:MAG: hypothetical protein IKB96_01605 [Prevotella sp.]|nr:hypothetical protein [Prevotella sp.]MBR2881045.1 hypothetical protein [Prevotella sp.]